MLQAWNERRQRVPCWNTTSCRIAIAHLLGISCIPLTIMSKFMRSWSLPFSIGCHVECMVGTDSVYQNRMSVTIVHTDTIPTCTPVRAFAVLLQTRSLPSYGYESKCLALVHTAGASSRLRYALRSTFNSISDKVPWTPALDRSQFAWLKWWKGYLVWEQGYVRLPLSNSIVALSLWFLTLFVGDDGFQLAVHRRPAGWEYHGAGGREESAKTRNKESGL